MKLTFYPITSANDQLFDSLWELYEKAFPIMERRDLALQKIIMDQETYHCEAILYNDEFAGLILWWQFNSTIYIEHLAIDNNRRGQGLGAKALIDFINKNEQGIILEVELPDKTNNKRRIAFYERLGFKLNSYTHKQWPLRNNGKELDLLLMSYPKLLTRLDYIEFQSELKKRCFQPFESYII
ncbi:MAG: GNAT family N-acetyltransferase [Bacteroidales bacterium]|nr:GNAT family N-acetyltransferase [Bacteroidales bacterium]